MTDMTDSGASPPRRGTEPGTTPLPPPFPHSQLCIVSTPLAQVGDIMGHFVAIPWGIPDPTSLVVVGAAATLGASCRAPLTAIALMVEITRWAGFKYRVQGSGAPLMSLAPCNNASAAAGRTT